MRSQKPAAARRIQDRLLRLGIDLTEGIVGAVAIVFSVVDGVIFAQLIRKELIHWKRLKK